MDPFHKSGGTSQSVEIVESSPDESSNEQDAQYAKPQVFKLCIATQIGIDSTFSLGRERPFDNVCQKEEEEEGRKEGSEI